jgi:hypothetical protein
VQRSAPVSLLIGTAAVIVLVNLLLAQAIVLAFYPQAAARLGPAGLGALGVAVVVGALVAVRGWRTYLRRPPGEER